MKSSWELVVATREPPLPFGVDTAARVIFTMIAGLAARGVPVRCLTLASRPHEVEAARPLLEPLLVAPLQWYPTAARGRISRLWQGLRRPLSDAIPDAFRRDAARLLADGPRLLQAELIPMGWVADGHPRAILSVHHLQRLDYEGVPMTSFRQWKSTQQSWRAERLLLRRYRWIRVTTPRLAAAVRAVSPAAAVAVVPITLDLARYPVVAPAAHPVVGLLGTMAWRPTREAAVRLLTRIWPLVAARVPEARLHLGGWNARRWLAPCGLERPGVTVVDDLPHPQAFVEQLMVMAYPTPQGSGMKVKVLEAMAYGVPVVTTPDGVEGLDVRSGVHAMVADDDQALADAVVGLLTQPARRQALRAAARRLLEDQYAPSSAAARLTAFYETVGMVR